MSDYEVDDKDLQVPMMVLTDMLKPPKTVTNLRVIPRTMEWDKITAIIIGGIIGLLCGIWVWPDPMMGGLYGATAGAAAFFMLIHITPFADESLWSWFYTTFFNKPNSIREDGTKRNLYIGIAPVKWSYEGRIVHTASAVSSPATYYDKRGYPLDEPMISADPTVVSYDAGLEDLSMPIIIGGDEIDPKIANRKTLAKRKPATNRSK